MDMSAHDIIKEACQKLELKWGEFELCEVKSSGQVVKINNGDVSVHSNISVNGRLYVMAVKNTEKTFVSTC